VVSAANRRRNGHRGGRRSGPVRYAVVGLGHIAQVAVLPGFRHARRNSELTALVSGDAEKLRRLAREYDVEHAWSYGELEENLRRRSVDAVYVALPNHLHRECTLMAARAGVHVLCEKPLALTERDCLEMIRTCDTYQVKLMTAYRLHFERANLRAVELVKSGRIGNPRFFDSTFSMQVEDKGNIRLRRAAGGGPLWDLGVYCINAARYLFRSEPEEVLSAATRHGDARFREVEEATSALLRFPGDRLATFTCSFGAADTSAYRIVGTEGDLRVDPAYEYAGELRHVLTVGERTQERTFEKRDQFGAEILYFSDCILDRVVPEPSGREGLADVRVIRAIQKSAEKGRAVRLEPFEKRLRPTMEQEIRRPPVKKPTEIRAPGPRSRGRPRARNSARSSRTSPSPRRRAR
jgi:predicted dehydrogenase